MTIAAHLQLNWWLAGGLAALITGVLCGWSAVMCWGRAPGGYLALTCYTLMAGGAAAFLIGLGMGMR